MRRNSNLKPSLYEVLCQAALETAEHLSVDECRIRGTWALRLCYQPNVGERRFEYDVAIVQTKQQGAAYGFVGDVDQGSLAALVGCDVRNCLPDVRSPLGVACLDALCGSFTHNPVRCHRVDGFSCDKAMERARIVRDEVKRLGGGCAPQCVRVVNVGAIGNIVRLLVDEGFYVVPTDLDAGIIGKDLFGCKVLDGKIHSKKAIEDADIAVVTGMTLATGALDDLMETAAKANTKLVIVAETGAWLAPFLLRESCIHCVVSEPFPFYIFSGTSNINVYTREAARE